MAAHEKWQGMRESNPLRVASETTAQPEGLSPIG